MENRRLHTQLRKCADLRSLSGRFPSWLRTRVPRRWIPPEEQIGQSERKGFRGCGRHDRRLQRSCIGFGRGRAATGTFHRLRELGGTAPNACSFSKDVRLTGTLSGL